MTTSPLALSSGRESIQEAENPLGLDGIEFIEYTTSTSGTGAGVGDDGVSPGRAR